MHSTKEWLRKFPARYVQGSISSTIIKMLLFSDKTRYAAYMSWSQVGTTSCNQLGLPLFKCYVIRNHCTGITFVLRRWRIYKKIYVDRHNTSEIYMWILSVFTKNARIRVLRGRTNSNMWVIKTLTWNLTICLSIHVLFICREVKSTLDSGTAARLVIAMRQAQLVAAELEDNSSLSFV